MNANAISLYQIEFTVLSWDIYFPMGVKSAWIVLPEFKAIQVVLPDDQKHYFDAGTLTDPATGIQISIEKVFEDLL